MKYEYDPDEAHLAFAVREIISTAVIMCRQTDLTPTQVRKLVLERINEGGPYYGYSYDFVWRDIANVKLFGDVQRAIQDY